MKKDTILFILSEIEKEIQKAYTLEEQLYLFERKEINLKKLNDMEEDKNQEEICKFCKKYILPDYNLRHDSLCEGNYCEEAAELFYESEDINKE